MTDETANALFHACKSALLLVPMMRPETCTERDRAALIITLQDAITDAVNERARELRGAS